MSEKKLPENEEHEVSKSQEQVKTKSKNQNAKREFGCPCGKEYLSYPALFTHIKQKHNGKAPGEIKKPKTEKARGRPRLPTVNMEEDNSVQNYQPKEQLERILQGKAIEYSDEFEESSGSKTCQDMASQFLREHSGEREAEKIVCCFLNYLRHYVILREGEEYWQSGSPQDVIDVANLMVRELDSNKGNFPLTRQLLIELTFVLFRWMYKHKWTDHKLVKRDHDGSEPK